MTSNASSAHSLSPLKTCAQSTHDDRWHDCKHSQTTVQLLLLLLLLCRVSPTQITQPHMAAQPKRKECSRTACVRATELPTTAAALGMVWVLLLLLPPLGACRAAHQLGVRLKQQSVRACATSPLLSPPRARVCAARLLERRHLLLALRVVSV
jgi:hypothetical protein